jgi:Predicted pPIWI-associating nuclease
LPQYGDIPPPEDALELPVDKRWQGALFALNPANPDAARHFCTSSREILAYVLDIEAPDDAVLARYPNCQRTDKGRPTRRTKIQFCLERKTLAAPELVDFADADLENVSKLFGVFNDATHGSAGTFDLGQLASLKMRVEDAIRFLH